MNFKFKNLSMSGITSRIPIGHLLWTLFFFGVLIRVFLALSTFHPDIRAFNLAGSLIAQGNILNLYDYIASCGLDNPFRQEFRVDIFIYPPLIYLLHGLFNFVISFLGGSYLLNEFIIEQKAFFGNFDFNLHLLLLKLPYFFFELPVAFLLASFFTQKREKILAFCLWTFNPVVLYSTYMMGQFDVIPASLTVLSLFLVKRNKLYIAALVLGTAAAFKLYPLFLVIPFIVIAKRWPKRFVLGVLCVLPYLMSIIPFLHSHGFRVYALMAGLTQKTLYAHLPVSAGENLMLFPLAVLVSYFYFYYRESGIGQLWQRWFVILLSFFIFTHFHPQWLTWLSPFLILEYVTSKGKHALAHLALLVSYIGMIFVFDPSLSVKIFSPLIPVLYSLPGTWEGFGIRWDEVYLRSLMQTLFAASGVFLIYLYFSGGMKEKEESK